MGDVLTVDDVALIRGEMQDRNDEDPRDSGWQDQLALCDSHEALRARVVELEGEVGRLTKERDEARKAADVWKVVGAGAVGAVSDQNDANDALMERLDAAIARAEKAERERTAAKEACAGCHRILSDARAKAEQGLLNTFDDLAAMIIKRDAAIARAEAAEAGIVTMRGMLADMEMEVERLTDLWRSHERAGIRLQDERDRAVVHAATFEAELVAVDNALGVRVQLHGGRAKAIGALAARATAAEAERDEARQDAEDADLHIAGLGDLLQRLWDEPSGWDCDENGKTAATWHRDRFAEPLRSEWAAALRHDGGRLQIENERRRATAAEAREAGLSNAVAFLWAAYCSSAADRAVLSGNEDGVQEHMVDCRKKLCLVAGFDPLDAALAAAPAPACPECKRLREALDAVLEFDVNESGDYGERTIAGDATEPIPVTVASILDKPTRMLARAALAAIRASK